MDVASQTLSLIRQEDKQRSGVTSNLALIEEGITISTTRHAGRKISSKGGMMLQDVMIDERWNFLFMGDYTAYPPDVWEYLIEFCVLWNFSAPTFSRKSKEGSRAVMWLNALREMQEVCGEFGLEAVREYRRYFEEYMENHNGLAPIRVDSPKSLLNELAGHAAIMRSRPKKEKVTLNDWIGETEEVEIDLTEIPQATLDRIEHGICTECGIEGDCIPIKGGLLCLEHYRDWRSVQLGLNR